MLWLTSEEFTSILLSCEKPVAIIVTRKSPMLSSSLIQPVIILASSFAISRILLPITSNSSVVRSEPEVILTNTPLAPWRSILSSSGLLRALSSPLLDNIDLQGASGVLVNITSGSDLTTDEFEVIGSKIREIANEDAKIITGCIKEDDNIGDLRVTIIATGFSQDNKIDVNSSEVNQSIQESTSNNPSISYPSNSEAKNDAITQVNVSQQEDQTSLDIPAFLRQQAD